MCAQTLCSEEQFLNSYIQNTQQLCHVRACLSFVTIIRSCDVAAARRCAQPLFGKGYFQHNIYETKICFYVVKCVNNAQGINRLDNDYILNIVYTYTFIVVIIALI